MTGTLTFIVTVEQTTLHTLSIEAESIEGATELLSDPSNPRITPIEQDALEPRITGIRALPPEGGDKGA